MWLEERMMKAWVRARRSETESEERRAVIARHETLVRELKKTSTTVEHCVHVQSSLIQGELSAYSHSPQGTKL